MARYTEVSFDGEPYKIPTLTIDQLERLSTLQEEIGNNPTQAKQAFALFKIIVEQIEPKAPEGGLRATMDEITTAINAVMGGSGAVKAGPPPGAA